VPKCFLTGVEIPLEQAYVLDISAARHLLRDLRLRISTLERLVDDLGSIDKVEVRDPQSGAIQTRKDRRLVSDSMAKALSSASPEKEIFVLWTTWRSRRPAHALQAQHSKKKKHQATNPQVQ
jgi:hypothetical protein